MKVEAFLSKIRDRSVIIGVVGLGYVGLPTAVFFAEKGFNVIGIDMKDDVVKAINSGRSPIEDLDLDDRLRDVVKKKRLSATTDTPGAVRRCDAVLIIVPTPVYDDKRPDLRPVQEAGKEIAKGLGPGKLVVLESTVYPGLTEEILKPLLESSGLHTPEEFGLAYCPERYNPGDPEHTIENVERIVAGIDERWGKAAQALYQTIIKRDVMLVRNIRTAEAAKVIENIQRDLNIALMNELALIFERMDIDVMEVIKAASTKWNFNIYQPGAGVGGHCLPVDPYYLVKRADELGYHARIITAGRAINDHMPEHVFELLADGLNDLGKPVKDAKVVVLGFSCKANTGDPRETPVEALVKRLAKMKADFVLIDPHIEDRVLSIHGKVAKDAYAALKGADACIVMTAHDEFKGLDLAKMKGLMRTPLIVDGRRMFDGKEAVRLGFEYRAIGMGKGVLARAPASKQKVKDRK